LSSKGITWEKQEARELMKGYTRSFAAYHNFFPYNLEEERLEEEAAEREGRPKKEPKMYRSGCWGYARVMESECPKVPVGTRLYGLFPPSKYLIQKIQRTVPANRNGDCALVEFLNDQCPFDLIRFKEYEVVESDPTPEALLTEDWRCATKELYTMAFYMDEQLLVETGMINSVIISCASSKTAVALAYVLRMRDMRNVWGLTSKEHLEFVKSTDLYHKVFTYDEVESLPNDSTVVYMDFRCDGDLRHAILTRMSTNLMHSMVIGPAMFQKRMKDQLFEVKKRETLFNEATWRERRRMVAEVTKTGRNEKLKYSYKAFVERVKTWTKLRHLGGAEAMKQVYADIYENKAPPHESYVISLHEDEFEGEELWSA